MVIFCVQHTNRKISRQRLYPTVSEFWNSDFFTLLLPLKGMWIFTGIFMVSYRYFQHSLPVFTKMCSERYEYRTAMCTVCIESPVGLWATWSLFCSSVIRDTLGYINGKECNCEEKLLFVWVKAETRVILKWSCRVVVLFYLVLSCDCLVWSCLASDCMQNVFLQHRPHQLPHSHDCVPLLHAHLTVACFVYPPSLSASVSIWTSRQ
jgi:hypothetical protein